MINSKMSRLASLIVLILYSTTLCNACHLKRVGQNDNNPCKASVVQERNCTTIGTPPDTRSSSTDHSRVLCIEGVARNFSECGQCTLRRGTPLHAAGYYPVQSGDWPWIVALGYRKGTNTTILWQCEGTLISDTWVITAAHCVPGTGEGLVLTTVRAGDLDLNDEVKDGASPVDIKVNQSIVHPEFSARTLLNDIALLRLNSSIKFNEKISAICLLNKEEYKSDKFYERKIPYYFVGWTHPFPYIKQESSRSEMIQEFEVHIEDVKNCSEKHKSEGYHNQTLINESVLCANLLHYDEDFCDTKGPMMIQINDSFYLAGISSYELLCPHLPMVYTRVAYFTDWIRNTTGIEI